MEIPYDESTYGAFDGLTVSGLEISQLKFVATDAGTLFLEYVEMGNIERLVNGQIEQSNIGGEVLVLKQSYWPEIYQLSFRFNNIRNCPVDREVIDYLRNSVGQIITLTDHTGQMWAGCITTPQSELTKNHRDSIVIDFEGTRIT